MIAIIFEAALRSFVLGALVWLALQVLRIKHPQLERNAWLVVLMAALAMPWMMQIELFAATATPALPWYPYVQMVAITAAGSGPPWMTVVLEGYVVVAGILLARQAIGLFKAWRLQCDAEFLDAASHILREEVKGP